MFSATTLYAVTTTLHVEGYGAIYDGDSGKVVGKEVTLTNQGKVFCFPSKLTSKQLATKGMSMNLMTIHSAPMQVAGPLKVLSGKLDPYYRYAKFLVSNHQSKVILL